MFNLIQKLVKSYIAKMSFPIDELSGKQVITIVEKENKKIIRKGQSALILKRVINNDKS